MAFSLYEATIPSYRQILTAVGGLLGKAESHCAEQKLAAEEIIQALGSLPYAEVINRDNLVVTT